MKTKSRFNRTHAHTILGTIFTGLARRLAKASLQVSSSRGSRRTRSGSVTFGIYLKVQVSPSCVSLLVCPACVLFFVIFFCFPAVVPFYVSLSCVCIIIISPSYAPSSPVFCAQVSTDMPSTWKDDPFEAWHAL